MIAVMTALWASAVWASDVYIDQAGSDVSIDILQQGGSNTINSENSPAVIQGDGISIDITQDGTGNTGSLNLANTSSGTTIDFVFLGDFNEFEVDFSTAIDNTLTFDVEGNNNVIRVCGDLACTSSSSVSDTTNIVNIDGLDNTVNLALGSDGATNTIDITGGSLGLGNTVDLVQTGTVTNGHTVDLTIDGDDNSVNITQGE